MLKGKTIQCPRAILTSEFLKPCTKCVKNEKILYPMLPPTRFFLVWIRHSLTFSLFSLTPLPVFHSLPCSIFLSLTLSVCLSVLHCSLSYPDLVKCLIFVIYVWWLLKSRNFPPTQDLDKNIKGRCLERQLPLQHVCLPFISSKADVYITCQVRDWLCETTS